MISALSVKRLKRQSSTYFFSVLILKKFWNDFENYWLSLTKKQRKLGYKSIIIGVLNEKSDLLNYLIILGKLYLWNCRKNSCVPVFSPFEVMVQSKYNTEKLIAVKGKPSVKRFEVKWKPFIK